MDISIRVRFPNRNIYILIWLGQMLLINQESNVYDY